MRLVAPLVVDYFAYAARPGALARPVALHAARRRLLRLHHASGSLGMSRGSSRGSSSTTSTTPRVRVSGHIVRLVVDYFAYAMRLGALARRAARRRLLCVSRASGCLGTSRGSSSTNSPTPRDRVPRHVAQLVTRFVVDYFDYAARLGALARRAARQAARHRLLRLRRASGCQDSSRGSLLTTSPMLWLVARLVIDYFAYAARSGASACRAAHRRLLRLCRATGYLGMSRGSSSTTSRTPRVRVPRHVVRLVVDYFTYAT
jgi:hypothetical protein